MKVSGDPALADDPGSRRSMPAALLEDEVFLDRMTDIPHHDEQGTRDRPWDYIAHFDPAGIRARWRGWVAGLGRPAAAAARAHRRARPGRPHLPASNDADDGERQRQALLAAAARFGMRVALPPRAAPQADLPGTVPLVGTLRWSEADAGWVGAWHMAWEGRDHTWGIAGVSFDAAFRDAVGGAAALLSARRWAAPASPGRSLPPRKPDPRNQGLGGRSAAAIVLRRPAVLEAVRMSVTTALPARPAIVTGTNFSVLVALSFCHMLNDMQQSLLPAIYPILKTTYDLDFGQIGLITLTFQLTASLLQPLVGLYTDRHSQPYSLAVGMGVHPGRAADAVAGRQLSAPCWPARRWSASARRCSTRNPRAWRGWPRAGGTGWRSRCSSSAAISAPRPGRCWPPSSCCRRARAASPGSRSPR